MLAQPEPSSLIIEPASRLDLPTSTLPISFDFSPDGGTLYCLVMRQSVDLSALALQHRSAIAGSLFALVLVAYLALAFRLRRRPQLPAVPHCRRCNYDLSTPAPHCPECGVDLARRKPVRGRTLRRRLALPTVALAAVGLMLGSLVIIPRASLARFTPELWSTLVDEYADREQIPWLEAHKVSVGRIIAVDSATGRLQRTIRTFREVSPAGIRVSPDGSHIVAGDKDHRMHWIRIASGHSDAMTQSGLLKADQPGSSVIAFDGPASDPVVYFASVHESSATSEVTRWHPRSGSSRSVILEPTIPFTRTDGTRGARPRSYAAVRAPSDLKIVSAPDSIFGRHRREDLALYSPAPRGMAMERSSLPHQPIQLGSRGPVGHRLLMLSTPTLFSALDLSQDPPVENIIKLDRGHLAHSAVLSQDDQTLFIVSIEGELFVQARDLVADRCIARLSLPAPSRPLYLLPSPCGRWLAVMGFDDSRLRPAGATLYSLFVHNIEPLKRG